MSELDQAHQAIIDEKYVQLGKLTAIAEKLLLTDKDSAFTILGAVTFFEGYMK